jgi:ketosteroid isomerase-like protein
MTVEDVIRTHTQAFYRALKARDFDALSKMYSDDELLVRPDGFVLWKEQVLRDLQAGNLTFNSIEITRDGKKARAHFRLVAVYVESGRALRLVYFQSVLPPQTSDHPDFTQELPRKGLPTRAKESQRRRRENR